MQAQGFPENEWKRLAAVRTLRILNPAPEQRLDRLTPLAHQMLGTQIALISLSNAE